MKNKNHFVGVGLLLLSILLAAGITWLFPVCGPKEDGSWMRCHWSGQTIFGIGIVLAALAIAYLLIPSRSVRAGLSLSVIPIGLLNLAVLNGLIGLCGKAEMQCRAVTQPAVTIISVILVILGIANGLFLLRAPSGEQVTDR